MRSTLLTVALGVALLAGCGEEPEGTAGTDGADFRACLRDKDVATPSGEWAAEEGARVIRQPAGLLCAARNLPPEDLADSVRAAYDGGDLADVWRTLEEVVAYQVDHGAAAEVTALDSGTALGAFDPEQYAEWNDHAMDQLVAWSIYTSTEGAPDGYERWLADNEERVREEHDAAEQDASDVRLVLYYLDELGESPPGSRPARLWEQINDLTRTVGGARSSVREDLA
jgi:hypothetical protein